MEIDVAHIAKLAKLEIPADKVEGFTEDMAAILAMVENLPPLEGGSLLEPDNLMRLRADEVNPSYPREQILQNAPQTAGGCFVVPKTVD